MWSFLTLCSETCPALVGGAPPSEGFVSAGQWSSNPTGDGPSPFQYHGSLLCHYSELGDSAKLIFDSLNYFRY